MCSATTDCAQPESAPHSPATLLPPSPNTTGKGSLIFLIVFGLVYCTLLYAFSTRRFQHFEIAIIGLHLCLLVPFLFRALIRRRSPVTTRLFVPDRWQRRILIACAALFAVTAGAVSYRVSQGILLSDENAYAFQARILATGRLYADPPPVLRVGGMSKPDVTDVVVNMFSPAEYKPVRYDQQIITGRGWYAKYSIGWPLLLAIPEALNSSWVVAPLLGLGLLFVIYRLASGAMGSLPAIAAVWIAALSPYYLDNSIGYMPHAFSGWLAGVACLLCVQALRKPGAAAFALMLVPLMVCLHVRPFTAFILMVMLSGAVLLQIRKSPKLFWRCAAVAISAFAIGGASIIAYNFLLTGSLLLSPYAQYRSTTIPPEISATIPVILRNLSTTWRWASQSCMAYSFPLVFLLAGYGFWLKRRDAVARILAALFPALMIGHLVQVERSASLFAERYWFEGFFAVAILAGYGMVELFRRLGVSIRVAAVAFGIVSLSQIGSNAAAIGVLEDAARPERMVRALAERYRHDGTAVFLADNLPLFDGLHLNLNAGDWKRASSIYLRDPGDNLRKQWADLFGLKKWAVITYDERQQRGVLLEQSQN
jgi:hypothetical protein